MNQYFVIREIADGRTVEAAKGIWHFLRMHSVTTCAKMHSAFGIVLQILHQTAKGKSPFFFFRCNIKVK